MPQNKVSEKYMQNLVLCRGPTHNYKQFPQFAPDRTTYSLLPKIDLLEMIKQDQDIQVVEESVPGASKVNLFLFKNSSERGQTISERT
jgi:hypothetical protein